MPRALTHNPTLLQSLLQVAFRACISPLRGLLLRKLRHVRKAADRPHAPPVPGMRTEGALPIRLTGEPAAPQVHDFVTWRSPTYIDPMTWEVADNLAAVLAGPGRARAMTEAELVEGLLMTPSAYLAERDGHRWVIDLRRTALYPHRTLTVRTVVVDPVGQTLEITDHEGVTHRRGDPTFSAALLHLTAWWLVYALGGLHNWVHFHLPDSMAEAHARLTNKDSVLARFLAPHVRFTSRINYAGLWENNSSHNPPDWRRSFTRLWAGPPTTSPEFRQGVVENTSSHYTNLHAHFDLPDSLDGDVPYLAALKAWYPPFLQLVEALDPAIDDADWAELIGALEVGLPGIAQVPRIKLLSVFAWQVGAVHATDHISIAKRVLPHAFMWPPERIEAPFTVDDIHLVDRWKTLNCLAVFVDYNANPELHNHLVDIDNYRFEGALHEAAVTFRKQLRGVASDLEALGLDLPGPDQLPQSVCF